MIDDRELDALLDDARGTWRVAPQPPPGEIWERVDAETAARRAARRPGWATVGIAAAAALAVGIAAGRYGSRPAPTVATLSPAAPAVTAAAGDPNHRAMGDLLGRTAVLLAELPGDTTTTLGPEVALESENLLTQTRLLLDSPVASDVRMRALLDDLELVLAQVARLEPAHRTDDLQLIHAALAEHDLVPRIRSAAATYAVNNEF